MKKSKHLPGDLKDLTPEQIRNVLIDNNVDPEDLDRYDEIVSRRRFFGLVGTGGATAALLGMGAGTEAALQGLFGRGMIPAAWAEEAEMTTIPGKEGMTIHNTRPVNGEFAPHLLDDEVTPNNRHFVRNNAIVSDRANNMDMQGWTLTIDGEVQNELKLSMDDLKKFPEVSLNATVECGGNGRGLFDPKVRGNPWGRGAIGCSKWTGVRLRDVLKKAGLKDSAVYTAHYGDDIPLGAAEPFSRGVPVDKAMDENTIIAYAMNGKPLPTLNGFPVRLVVPGWIGSCSQKWLNRIWVRDQVHDSHKMTGFSYRVPKYPVVPGTKPPEEDMMIATTWHIKSMITSPEPNTESGDGKVKVRGHAWAGEDTVKEVYLSIDYGLTWKKAKLHKPANKYAWANFEGEVKLPGRGYYEIWARAVDQNGNTQPARQPWNPKGYLGNVIHRVPVMVPA
jgi:DMSO/TMAO reductase YedYZ molybdopterin-dependent catalytic subunit